jgi:hypothetical protein
MSSSETCRSRVTSSGGPKKQQAAPSANVTDICARPCSNSITAARLVGPASIAPGTRTTCPVSLYERNSSRFRLIHRLAPGPGRSFSTDVRGCSPAW